MTCVFFVYTIPFHSLLSVLFLFLVTRWSCEEEAESLQVYYHPRLMVFFRSGHPRTLSTTRQRRPTTTPCRHVVHPYYPTRYYRPNFHPSLGLVLFSLLFITLLPFFRLPLPYSYNPTHSIPSCYCLLDLVSSTQPLMCIISTRAARQCKHVFSPPSPFPFVLCFLHLINRFPLLCIFLFLLPRNDYMAMTRSYTSFYYYFYDVLFVS